MYGYYNNINMQPDPGMIAMQERLKRMQQQAYAPQPLGTYGIKGRMVTSIDEARAAQIDFDGSASYFPCPAEHKIYVKSLDLNGNPIFEVYQLANNGGMQQPVYVENGAFMALQQRVEQLEVALKGVVNNVQPNANVTNDGQQP